MSVAVGASSPGGTIEAWNAGDGTLHLNVRSTVAWLTASAGALRPCQTRSGMCYPIGVSLQTQSLARGTYTAVVRVNDANALDAPQTITVIAAVGGGIPDRYDFFVPPNGTAEGKFTTNTNIGSSVPAQTDSGGAWLQVSLDGSGSFDFVQRFKVKVTAQPGMAEGTYNGSFAVSKSALAAENKPVSVTMRVTPQPIAAPGYESLHFRIAQGAVKQTVAAGIGNRGLGTLTLSGATASGGAWLAASASESVVNVTADPTGLAVGSYSGSVNVNTNAVNTPTAIPVMLSVVAPEDPIAAAGGVLTNLSTTPEVAPGTIASIYGEQFTYKDPIGFTTAPLETTLGGVRVLVNDLYAPIFYTSYGQINFLVPIGTKPGVAQVSVEREGAPGNIVTTNVVLRAPRILPLAGSYGIIVNQDGSFPLPSSYGPGFHPAKAGDALVIYALGLGPTAPEVKSGEASPAVEPLARVVPETSVVLKSGLTQVRAETFYSGLTPTYVGLYQINFYVPTNAPKGDAVQLQLRIGGDVYSPQGVTLAIQ